MRLLLSFVLVVLMSFDGVSQSPFSITYDFEIDFNRCYDQVSQDKKCFDEFSVNVKQGSVSSEDSLKLSKFTALMHESVLKEKTPIYSCLDFFEYYEELKVKESTYIKYKSWYIRDNKKEKELNIKNGVDSIHDYSAVNNIRIVEEWYFNKQTNEIITRDISVAPVFDKFNDKGEFMGWQPMYQVKMNGHVSYTNAYNLIKDENIIWGHKFELNMPVGDIPHSIPEGNNSQSLKSIFNSSLQKILHERITSGEIKAYKVGTDSVYTTSEIDSLLTTEEYEYIENENGEIEELKFKEVKIHNDMAPLKVSCTFDFDPETYVIKSTINKIIVSYYKWVNTAESYTPILSSFEIRF